MRLSRSSPERAFQPLNEMVCSFGRSRMRNEMKMNNHHILSNTAIWHLINEPLPKVTISNDGRSKTSFSFPNISLTFQRKISIFKTKITKLDGLKRIEIG